MNNPDPFDPHENLDKTLHGGEKSPTTAQSNETGEDDEPTADTVDRNPRPSDGFPLVDDENLELDEIAHPSAVPKNLGPGSDGTLKSSPAHHASLHQWGAASSVDAAIGGGADADRLP